MRILGLTRARLMAAVPSVQLRALDYLSEVERKSITDTVGGFVEFAKRRLVSLVADHMIPGVGGRVVDLARTKYAMWWASVQALALAYFATKPDG